MTDNGGEFWVESGYILEGKLTVHGDGLDVQCEGKRRIILRHS